MTMKDSEYVQVKLLSTKTGLITTCWLDKPSKFEEGSIISLKGDTERYEVIRKYHTKMKKSELHTDWKVGGLS